jgi:hypothetical protein
MGTGAVPDRPDFRSKPDGLVLRQRASLARFPAQEALGSREHTTGLYLALLASSNFLGPTLLAAVRQHWPPEDDCGDLCRGGHALARHCDCARSRGN